MHVKSEAVILTLLLAAATSASSSAALSPVMPIVAIRIVRHDVFDVNDPDTSAWPYRAANALHVVTREQFIRSLLLFREGDPLDAELLEESARLLRATGFLSPVTVTSREIEGGAEVVVETFDQWTTRFGVNFGLYGNRNKIGVSLAEANFLGSGKGVEAEYRSDEERNSTTLSYEDPLFLGTRVKVLAAHRESSDGSGDAAHAIYPFFALATPWAGGVEWWRESLTEYLYADAEKAVAGHAYRRDFRLWGGMRVPSWDDRTDRLIVGLFGEVADYDDWSFLDGRSYETPADRTLAGVEVGWERQMHRYEVVNGFRAWQRQEDLALGPNWSARLGVSLPALGGASSVLTLAGTFDVGMLRESWYSWVSSAIDGRLDHGHPQNVVLHVEAGTARTGEAGWRARLAADLSQALDRDRQLALGVDTGLRGWDPDTFDGTGRVVANLEWRHRLTGEVLHLAVLGLTTFVDVGRTWGARVGRDTGTLRGDVGIGLLAEITRASLVKVARIEVAFPDDGSGPVFLIVSGSIF
jgi:hypothetical protein